MYEAIGIRYGDHHFQSKSADPHMCHEHEYVKVSCTFKFFLLHQFHQQFL